MVDQGLLEVPIAEVYPLADVRAADKALDQRHTRGKIVLVPEQAMSTNRGMP